MAPFWRTSVIPALRAVGAGGVLGQQRSHLVEDTLEVPEATVNSLDTLSKREEICGQQLGQVLVSQPCPWVLPGRVRSGTAVDS